MTQSAMALRSSESIYEAIVWASGLHACNSSYDNERGLE